MKIKTSFVTNSSTCNFILLGFKVKTVVVSWEMSYNDILKLVFQNETDEEINEIEKQLSNRFFLVGGEAGAPDEFSILVGEPIFVFDSNHEEGSEEDLKIIKEIKRHLKTIFGVRDYKLYFGTRMC